ncbi:MAG: hypothetical protein H8E66_25865 [Planctomycetes bacterium]|nr:hypothetical protein [Planctomycetota bacterium]
MTRQQHTLLSSPDVVFLDYLRNCLVSRNGVNAESSAAAALFKESSLPQFLWGVAITLYQPDSPRLMVVRATNSSTYENIRQAINRTTAHERFDDFDLGDLKRCRVQIDFIVHEPEAVELSEFSDSTIDVTGPKTELPIHARQNGEPIVWRDAASWQVQVVSALPVPKNLARFELGVDGLRIVKEGKRRYVLPGDAFVRSILGISQLRRHIQRLFPGDDIETLKYYRFRSLSFVSGVVESERDSGRDATRFNEDVSDDREPRSWLPLYRGLPPIPAVNDVSLTCAARAGTKWIADSLQTDGRFIYYYDAATDTQRDHEHPRRDPETDPYYNLLRHGGGVITLLLDEQLGQAQSLPTPSAIADQRREVIERASDFLVQQLVDYQAADGTKAAYALYNRKAKLGGSGIGLCALAMYQRLFRDDRFADVAARLAHHLRNEINEHGEFRYYHIYLDKPVGWEDNQKYFSFYYPGEAILGLSQYCQHVCQADAERQAIYAKTHQALRFLLCERPHLHKEHYQTLPSDSWLMMGINDLWDVAEFQQEEYKKFVFDDADQMVRLMYTEEDAIYPDYVGSFYYHYGDHPYPDGARAEGLLSAYQLALKVGDQRRVECYRHACYQVAAATLRLCNTADSVYSAANPERAMGGIRFKLTRQWFRVDTIQHVASFYLKLLATTSEEISESASNT